MPEKAHLPTATFDATASPSVLSDRRAQILQAAARVIAEKGYHGATTKEIAEAAQVSEGSLYNYFENKEDLIFNILAFVTETELQMSESEMSLTGEPDELFSHYLLNRKKFWDENATMLTAIMSEILSNPRLRTRYQQTLIVPSLARLESLLSQQQQKGHIRDVDIAQISQLLLAVMLGLYHLHALDDNQSDEEWERLAQLTSDVLFRGLTHLPKLGDEFIDR